LAAIGVRRKVALPMHKALPPYGDRTSTMEFRANGVRTTNLTCVRCGLSNNFTLQSLFYNEAVDFYGAMLCSADLPLNLWGQSKLSLKKENYVDTHYNSIKYLELSDNIYHECLCKS
jgi:hypothetical protein